MQQRNRHAWLSIAKFIEVDPLAKLGLAGGWVRPEAAPAEGAPLAGKGGSGSASVSSLPVGNHGDNNL